MRYVVLFVCLPIPVSSIDVTRGRQSYRANAFLANFLGAINLLRNRKGGEGGHRKDYTLITDYTGEGGDQPM